jgi:hypothetical protein
MIALKQVVVVVVDAVKARAKVEVGAVVAAVGKERKVVVVERVVEVVAAEVVLSALVLEGSAQEEANGAPLPSRLHRKKAAEVAEAAEAAVAVEVAVEVPAWRKGADLASQVSPWRFGSTAFSARRVGWSPAGRWPLHSTARAKPTSQKRASGGLRVWRATRAG